MSERKRATSTARDYWQGVSAHAAVQWHEVTHPAGMIETVGPVGLVFYGNVSWRGLQDLELARMTTMRPGFPEFEGTTPPDPETLRRRWESDANRRKREEVRRLVEDPDFRKSYKSSFVPKGQDETAGDFYNRVSDFYRMRQALTGTPTSDLAEAAGVPKTTAARWVREARARGYLPTTKRGRGSS